MSTQITQKDILQFSTNSGLMSCLFDIANKFPQRELASFSHDVVDLVNSGRISLFSEVDKEYLNQTSGYQYFRGMRLVCEIIPSFKVDHNTVLRLVETLVERAGQDLAAITPYTALKLWCEKHPQEARDLVENAECLNDKPLNYISFVFEGLNDYLFVLKFFKETKNPKLQSEAVTALGRMTLNNAQASEAIEILAEASVSSNTFCVRSNSLFACYAILGEHGQISRESLQKGLEHMINHASTEVSNVLLSLLWIHGRNLTEDEWALIIGHLKTVPIDTPELLNKIDHVALSAKEEIAFFELADLIQNLIANARGQLTLDNFAHFQQTLLDSNTSRLSKVTARWLMKGDFHVCRAIEQAFSRFVSRTIELELDSDDLPMIWHEQLFLCRKAVGWLFSVPVSAASVLIFVLQYGHKKILQVLCEMLYYPLLINYYDVVRPYLEEKMEQHSDVLTDLLGPVLDDAHNFFENLQHFEYLSELQPNEVKQFLRSARDHDQFMTGWRSVESRSILNEVVSKKHLIYGNGNTWATYVCEADGRFVLRRQRLKSHSVSVPYPQLNSLDHARLSRLLLTYRNEQRVEH